MAHVSEIMNEVAEVVPLLRSDTFSAAVKSGCVNALVAKIQSLRLLSPKDAMALAAQINSVAEPHSSVLLAAVDVRLAQCVEVCGGTSLESHNATQQLTMPLSYLTANDWLGIEDPSATKDSIISTILARSSKLGIRKMHERTVKAFAQILVAIIKARTKSWPTYSQIYGWVNDVKAGGDQLNAPWPFATIYVYPTDPHALPTCVFEAGYDADDPPIIKDLPGYHALGKHIPLRRNSALLHQERTQSEQSTAGSQAIALDHLWQLMSGKGKGKANAEQHIPGLSIYGTPRPAPSPWDPPPAPQLALQGAAFGNGAAPDAPLDLADKVGDVSAATVEAGHPVLQRKALQLRASDSAAAAAAQVAMRFKVGEPRVGAASPVAKAEPSLAVGDAKAEPSSSVVGAKAEPSIPEAAEEFEEAAFCGLLARAAANAKRTGLATRPAAKAKLETGSTSGSDDGSRSGDHGDGDDDSDVPPHGVKAIAHTMKRPASAASASPTGIAMKRPASADKDVPAAKRPATPTDTMPNLKDIKFAFTITEKDIKDTPIKTLTSRYWHYAKRIAVAQGFDVDQANAFGRAAHKETVRQVKAFA
jgi:hypothetical protein